MADETNNGSPPDLSEVLGQLLANKELMDKIGEIANGLEHTEKTDTQDTGNEITALLSDPNMLSKLPEVIGAISPLVSSKSGNSQPHNSRQIALLMALKPYLSPKRCEAIDYIAKISRLSQTFKGLKL